MSTDDIWNMGADEIVSAVHSKEVSCLEVVHAHLARIDAVNQEINAVTVVLAEEALRAAEAIDQKILKGLEVGPLAGVPCTVKENIDLAGSATTFGLAALRDAVPSASAPQVENLLKAGAIPIGRTNLSELGLRPHTANPLRGATRNPWDHTRTPGGSSGGDAAAVATGMTPLGLGNDYGGSLRAPAHFCGITSLKPSWGRVPDHMSLMPSEPAISTQLFLAQGPMARRVADLRLAIRAMSAGDWRDPHWVPAPLEWPASEGPLRVAVTVDPAGQGVDPCVARGVQKASKWLEESGYIVEQVEPPRIMDAWRNWGRLTGLEIQKLTLPAIRPVASNEAITFLEYWLRCFSADGLDSYMEGLAQRNRLARQWNHFMGQYPLILGPVLSLSTPLADFDIGSFEETERFLVASRLITAANLLGLPAISVPVGMDEGLPQSVQIIAPRFREDLCLDAAEALEQGAGVLTPIDPTG